MNQICSIWCIVCSITALALSEEVPEASSDFGSFEEIAEFAEKGESVTDTKKWIGDFAYIEVVVYDPSEGARTPLIQKGKFHKGLRKEWTKRLTKEDAKKVVSSITGKHKWEGGARCYEPHHGFVFYDADHKILGHVEICFMCGNYYSYPKEGLSDYWALGQLQEVVRELGLPVFKGLNDWTKFFDGTLKVEQTTEAD